MNMKDMIQRMTDLENTAKQELTESRRIAECPPDQVEASPVVSPASEGTPVSVNVNITASGKEHVSDLLAMMKAAGLDDAQQMKPDMMPMRQDMDRLRAIVDEPEMEADGAYADGFDDDLQEWDTDPEQERSDRDESMEHLLDKVDPKWQSKTYSEKQAYKFARAVEQSPANRKNPYNVSWVDEDDVVDLLDRRGQIDDNLEEYDNEPDEKYRDHEYMTHDLSGGINRRKKSYSDAEDGDNAMAVKEKEADPVIIAKVQELSNINDLDVLKKEVYDLVKNTKMNKAKKMQLMRNAENSRTVKNLIGLLWNTFVLGAENKHALDSSWGRRFENSEDEMRESIKSQLLKSLEEKKAKPDYIDLDGDGDKKEPMKKAAKDKKSKKKNKVDEGWRSGTTTFLMIERIKGKLGNRWSLMDYEGGPSANPIHLRRMLNEHAEKLGWEGYDVPTQWSGDIDEVLNDAKEKLSSDQNWVSGYEMELKTKVRELTQAKKIMAAGKQVQPEG